MSRTHLPRLVAIALGVGALLALPGVAGAQSGGTIQVHALFSGGKTSGFTVGQPLGVTYIDASGQTREKQVCWSPAPIEQPSCTASGTGAANVVGPQTITVQLTNGQSVKTTFNVAAAPTTLGSGSSNTPPVPYTVVKSVTLTGDVSGDPLYQLTPGDRVAAYYRANSTTLQVYDYATNTAGFAASSALTAPKPQASTTSGHLPAEVQPHHDLQAHPAQGLQGGQRPGLHADRLPTVRRPPTRLGRRQLHHPRGWRRAQAVPRRDGDPGRDLEQNRVREGPHRHALATDHPGDLGLRDELAIS